MDFDENNEVNAEVAGTPGGPYGTSTSIPTLFLPLRDTMKGDVSIAFAAIESELEYSQRKWDDKRDEKGLMPDSHKPLNSWLVWAFVEINRAIDADYQSLDNGIVLDHVRKAVGHLIRAMLYHGVRGRSA